MTAPAYLQPPYNGMAQKGQIAQRVQDLMTHELLREPQAIGIQDAGVIQDYGVVQGTASGQSPGLEELNFL